MIDSNLFHSLTFGEKKKHQQNREFGKNSDGVFVCRFYVATGLTSTVIRDQHGQLQK